MTDTQLSTEIRSTTERCWWNGFQIGIAAGLAIAVVAVLAGMALRMLTGGSR